MNVKQALEVWFVVGSQHLYGPKTLEQVAADAQEILGGLNQGAHLPVKLVAKPVVKTPDEILAVCRDANHAEQCVGLMVWMHTFSPAKMWIAGLSSLEKPLLQFHTQFNRDIPWDSIDMDFMNLNQTAHGGREFGFIGARLRLPRTVVVGHWQDKTAHRKIADWMRVCSALHDSQRMKVARFGDNMRQVAVTEGDKVEAQLQLGYQVNGFGISQLAAAIEAISDAAVAHLIEEYEASYHLTAAAQLHGPKRQNLLDAARIELGLKSFLEQGDFQAFTTTFEDLHGLKQLPGLAVQRLMQQGYGFGAEGDWKTAALLRTMKVMSAGLPGGTSFMEDYTYHFDPAQQLVLGAHMLEVCPSIAAEDKPTLDIQPLGIGGKDDPARLLFNAAAGPALNASLIDMGNRFRLIVNEVDAVTPPHAMPKLPVAQAMWQPRPSLPTAAEAWILAGGAHHTVFSQALTSDMLQTYATILGLEFVRIGADTTIPALQKELAWNEVYYKLR